VDIFNVIFSHVLSICRLADKFDAKMCELTPQIQVSVAMLVNNGRIFNDFFIANLLLSVTVKEF